MKQEDKKELKIERKIASVLKQPSSAPKGAGPDDAAVLILIRRNDGKHLTLLEKRATSSSDPWSGQVAFPGGRFKTEDITLDATACREFFEETRVNICQMVKIIGYLDPVSPGNHPEVKVVPFVAFIDREIFPSPTDEVQKFFWVPLEELIKSEFLLSSGESAVKRTGYIYQGEIIWGMTQRLIDQLMKFLFSDYEEEANS
ncbi:MAG: CoA pyrophosphatase [Conexivisphaerales archaeon]